MAGQPAGGWAPPAQAPLAFVPSSFEAAPEAQHAPQPHQHRGPPGGGYAADPSFSRPSFAAPSFAQSLSQPHYAPPPYGAPPPARFSALPASGSSGELYRHPVGGAVGHATFDDEPPLLEELGIDLRHILRKTRSMLTPFAADAALCDDADLAGPLVFAAALGVCHLLARKDNQTTPLLRPSRSHTRTSAPLPALTGRWAR